MKKIAFIVAAAGLMTLAACNKPADTAVDNNVAAANNPDTIHLAAVAPSSSTTSNCSVAQFQQVWTSS